ncbi:MAG: class I SAM-dependent methyltransferase [Candidatus Aenigmarchaeota archaeon]|nr:class I SAM-dependent methyltransferase [Candidatus Aenigmarchaeota archaeon]
MSDIAAYGNPDNYIKYQNLRPDYGKAVSVALQLAKKYTKNKKITLADFCCGTGSNTKKLASVGKIEKAILIDVNRKFLETARKTLTLKNLELLHQDVLEVSLKKECDLILSIFAYHHMPDDKKELYLRQIESCLKKGGIVVLAEIYLEKNEILNYYTDLLKAIPKKSKGLKEFLEQTAISSDIEFKVSKKYAEKQILKKFEIIEEVKIWPKDKSEKGTFVQVLKLK